MNYRGLRENSYTLEFTFDQEFSDYKAATFLKDFLNSPEVNARLKVKGRADLWGTLGPVKEFKFERLSQRNAYTDLRSLDKLEEHNIVRANGDLVKCLDEYTPEGFTVSDNLRKALLLPESEEYLTFSKEDRQQLLIRILQAVALGGKICQYEDSMENYIEVVKTLYRDLTSVSADADGNLTVDSVHYSITDAEGKHSPLFPLNNLQNFCYVNIIPSSRHVIVWYHASDVFYQ